VIIRTGYNADTSSGACGRLLVVWASLGSSLSSGTSMIDGSGTIYIPAQAPRLWSQW
jgi:hypothetical protein